MSNKVIVLDEGYIKHRAIFAYRSMMIAAILYIIGHPESKEPELVTLAQEIFIDTDLNLGYLFTILSQNKDKIVGNISIVEQKILDIRRIPITYTFLRMIVGYLKRIGIDENTIVIFAQDFGSWRKKIDFTYKAQRAYFRASKASDDWWKKVYGEFNDFYVPLEAALPWQFCKILSDEADDIASVACRYYTNKEIILVSADKDWEMLCDFSNVKIFSPLQNKKTTKPRYKIVPNPMAVLIEKIHGDVSDNLLKVPSSEKEWNIRKMIVDLINPLPDYIEQPIIEKFRSFLPKNLYIHKIPYRSIAEDIKKLYKF